MCEVYSASNCLGKNWKILDIEDLITVEFFGCEDLCNISIGFAMSSSRSDNAYHSG